MYIYPILYIIVILILLINIFIDKLWIRVLFSNINNITDLMESKNIISSKIDLIDFFLIYDIFLLQYN